MGNNLWFGDAPSHVTAKTFSEFSSHILIAFLRNGNIWDDVAPVVATFAQLNLNGLTALQIKNTRTCGAISVDFYNVAKFSSVSPKST